MKGGQMDLAKLRVYMANERSKTALAPVLVVTDGDERIVIRTTGDAEWLKVGADRLLSGALSLVSTVAPAEVPDEVGP
jgi:hypothetical protein